jgi:rhodanese-related sulfurtransferase
MKAATRRRTEPIMAARREQPDNTLVWSTPRRNVKQECQDCRTWHPILIICRGGVRSGKAMAMMQAAGFAAAHNLDGGLLRWQAEKRPMVVGSPIS